MMRNPMIALIESLFRNYPYMKLHQRIIVLTALSQAFSPDSKALREAVELIPKALELEVTIYNIEEMFRKGEVAEIDFPNEIKKLYEIEIKLLSIIFKVYVRHSDRGVEKYV